MQRILVIDDEAPMREMLTGMLGKEGFEVDAAGDGDAGLELFRRCRPDLVVTDILMPHIGGLVAIREMRDLDPSVKIIAISGGGSDGKLNFLSTARTFKGVKTLQKPFRHTDLMAAVRGALGEG